MVMMAEPLRAAIQDARKGDPAPAKVIYLSPQGRRLEQSVLRELALQPRLILLTGRYEGVDERLVQSEVDEELSLGDYVLSGGELAAMVVIDGVTRLLPGALGHRDSAQQDSFTEGLLDCPHYTRPEKLGEMAVPDVLLSGNHQAIARWREKEALGRTWLRRPDLLKKAGLSERQKILLREYVREWQEQRNDLIEPVSGENDEQHH